MLTFILCLLGLVYLFARMQPFIDRIRGIRSGPLLPGPPRPRRVPSSNQSNDVPDDDDTYKPSPIDIVVARVLMTRGLKLPPDLVDSIFDFAEYWAHSSNEIDFQVEQKSPLVIVGRSRKEDHLLVRSFPVGLTGLEDRKDLDDVLQYDRNETKPQPLRREHAPNYFAKLANYPTPRLMHPVRKVVFTMRSRDQGLGMRTRADNYGEGWTWFEAGLERFDEEQDCNPQCVPDSRHKSQNTTPSSLPTCALRSIYPALSEQPRSDDPNQTSNDSGDEPRSEYYYDHGYLPAEERLIQRNRTRHREMKTHVVQWSWTDDIDPESDRGKELNTIGRGRGTGDGQFVRDLKLGDVITVWGKAKFPAWQNFIERVKIDVYWAV